LITFVAGGNFIILGLAFGLTGLMNNMRLKFFFNHFYSKNRAMLVFATLGLSVSMLLRGSLDLFRHFDPDFQELIGENIALYDSIIFIIGDVIPISF
jgi:hypothetical protein